MNVPAPDDTQNRSNDSRAIEKHHEVDAVSITASSTFSELTEDKAFALLNPQQMETLVESISQQVAAARSRNFAEPRPEVVQETVAKLMANANRSRNTRSVSKEAPESPKRQESAKKKNYDANTLAKANPPTASACGSLYYEPEALNDPNFWNADFFELAASQLDNLGEKRTNRPVSFKQNRSAYLDAQDKQQQQDEDIVHSDFSTISGLTGEEECTTHPVPDPSLRPACVQQPIVRRPSLRFCRQVHFSTLEIREYTPILGDNPGCMSGGPTLAIGWSFCEMEPQDVDDYESQRRRTHLQPLDRSTRLHRVQSWGYSPAQIASAVRSVNRIQFQRQQTLHNLHAQGMEEAVERVQRQVKKLFQRRRQDDKHVHDERRSTFEYLTTAHAVDSSPSLSTMASRSKKNKFRNKHTSAARLDIEFRPHDEQMERNL